MRGLNNPFPAPDADDVHRRFSLGPSSLLLREEAPWKKNADEDPEGGLQNKDDCYDDHTGTTDGEVEEPDNKIF